MINNDPAIVAVGVGYRYVLRVHRLKEFGLKQKKKKKKKNAEAVPCCTLR
jgi:hypothetical protein